MLLNLLQRRRINIASDKVFLMSLNSWPQILRYSHDLNPGHTKPCLADRQALPFQDYFYRYYKTLPSSTAKIFIIDLSFLECLFFRSYLS